MEANEYQIGGTHYQTKYQCWDFIIDSHLHFLTGNAIKYISRWRVKGGEADLRKALHYINKAHERNIPPSILRNSKYENKLNFYAAQMKHKIDSNIIRLIANGHYGMAAIEIDSLIKNVDEELRKISIDVDIKK